MTVKIKSVTPVSGGVTLTWAPGTGTLIVLWRPHGAATWSAVEAPASAGEHAITGLTGGEKYDVRIAVDSGDSNSEAEIPASVSVPVNQSSPVVS